MRPARIGAERPWWLFAFAIVAGIAAVAIASSGLYAQIFAIIVRGIGVTIFVTLTAFALALAMGLAVALAGLSRSTALRQTARFYVEVIRGIPILVLLFYIAFVGAPAIVSAYNGALAIFGLETRVAPLAARDLSLVWRAIFALALGYSAFVAEVLRAGFQAVERGQIEAAMALGLSRMQRFRLIVWPQALRTVFPPLSNDFVAMVKDSSLVSVLGVADITQLAKIYAAGSFRFFETYSIVAYVYLLLTIGLSLMLRRIERGLAAPDSRREPGLPPGVVQVSSAARQASR